MQIAFATCERHAALGFIQAAYPDREIADAADSAGPLLDLVEKDIVRIEDPGMHGRCGVIPGTNFKSAGVSAEQIREACELFNAKG